jgi:excinuclease ABC subunit C
MSESNRDRLERQVVRLPVGAGVYMFRDRRGRVLYVGKAVSLRSRVRSYLRAQRDPSPKLRQLAGRIASVESYVVDSESEALLLEWNLIREYRPHFNIQLRDDKSYPYIRVTLGEAFPRVQVTRRLVRDGSRYYGPYTDVGAMRSALRMIKELYTVRSCHYALPKELPPRPCLDYHIGRCKAPCAGYQTEGDYQRMIDEILEVLGGRTGAVRRRVRERMDGAAEMMDFERAAELRDVLRGLESIERRQAAVDHRGGDHDVVGLERQSELACGVILKVREGRLLGREIHFLQNVAEESDAALTAALVSGHYLRRQDLPRELLVPEDFPDRELVEEHLSARSAAPVSVLVPQRGRKRRLIELATSNAADLLREEHLRSAGSPKDELEAGESVPAASVRIRDAFGLPSAPRSIVCFDISTLAGADSVGSAVWIRDGKPRTDEYRRFRIRETPEGQTDDYAMMQEVVRRYFDRRIREARELPDLVLIDGGRGQLGAALQAMEAAGVSDLPALALAKREEEVYRQDAPDPVRLDRRDPALHWMQRARDEAHRFALAYNRTLRRRRTLRSRLSRIPGIGPAREQELLRRFGSMDAIRSATLDELTATPGVGPGTAERIQEALIADG